MRKLVTFAAAVGLALGIAATPARAADHDKSGDKTGEKTVGQNANANKRLAFVDLYLGEAVMAAKALSTLADGAAGKTDGALVSEARGAIDTAIDKAQAHVKAMRSGVKGADAAKIAELDQHLRDARDASKRLGSAKSESLTTGIDAVSTQLMAARDSFKELAKQLSYTPLENQNLGTMPVKGSTPPSMPGTTTTTPSPSGTTPPSPGATPTPSPSGTQPNEDKTKHPDSDKDSPILTPAKSDQPPPPKSP